jgi:hypothetical protein
VIFGPERYAVCFDEFFDHAIGFHAVNPSCGCNVSRLAPHFAPTFGEPIGLATFAPCEPECRLLYRMLKAFRPVRMASPAPLCAYYDGSEDNVLLECYQLAYGAPCVRVAPQSVVV